MTRLTAVWSPETEKPVLAATGQKWPLFQARKCQLFLKSVGAEKIQWPARLEWWGPVGPHRLGPSQLARSSHVTSSVRRAELGGSLARNNSRISTPKRQRLGKSGCVLTTRSCTILHHAVVAESGTGAGVRRRLLGRVGFPPAARVGGTVVPCPVPAVSHAAC